MSAGKAPFETVLSDFKVIDFLAWMRWLIVNAFILPSHSKHSAALYQQIWTEQDYLYQFIVSGAFDIHKGNVGRRFYRGVGDVCYGGPSIRGVLQELQAKQFQHLIVFPLFPQFSS